MNTVSGTSSAHPFLRSTPFRPGFRRMRVQASEAGDCRSKSTSHFGLSTQLSRFRKTTGTVTFDAKAKTGQADITIDMTTVNTGLPDFNEHLRGEDFLDTAKHSTATCKSTRVLFDGDKPSGIEGLLTIKGITRPVTLTVTTFGLTLPWKRSLLFEAVATGQPR